MSNPYVFIVGCPRSGTTLLRRIINAHRQIAITPESQWIPRWFEERRGLTPEGLITPDLISRLLEHRRFALFQISRGDLERLLASGQPMSYSRFHTGIFDLYGKAQGKALVGDKTPRYVEWLPTLHALWPEARYVHLIRDGRDVCLSMADWPKAHRNKPGVSGVWKDDPVLATALWWERKVRLGREAGSSLGPELYYEIRYESLVSQPAEECEALCAFLGLPYDDAMLRFHEGRTKTDPGLDAKAAWLPITPGLRDWRSQMPAEDMERFEAAAGGLLEELGYPRGVPQPHPEALEHASSLRSVFAKDFPTRSNWNGRTTA